MKKVIRVMSSDHGDCPVEFDDSDAMAKSYTEAEALFNRIRRAGGAVFNVIREDAPVVPVTNFKDLGQESIAVPRIVSG